MFRSAESQKPKTQLKVWGLWTQYTWSRLRWRMLCWWCLRSFKLTLSRSKKDLAWNHAMIFNNPLSSLTTMNWNEFRKSILFYLNFVYIKVRTFWETHKIWKIFFMVLTNQLIYLVSKLQNHEQDFFQIMCASQKVQTLKKVSDG